MGTPAELTRRRRIAVLTLAGIVLATAAVVAVALGNAGKHAERHPIVTSLIAELADPDSRNVNSVAFSPDGKTLATADENGSAYLWDVATRTEVAILTGSQGVQTAAFSPDGKTLATGDYDGFTLWDITGAGSQS